MNLFEVYVEQFSYTFSIFKEEYIGILTFLSIAIILASIIAGLSYSLISQNPESEKLSSYECGFEPYEDTKNKFDIKFCLVAILFILFDIEVIFLLPWSVTLSQLNLLGFWSMIDFLLELGIGFVYAWKLQSLDW
uniref:NADH dehydrogenase subunit 3 n=1 Tax=Navicula tsukamotoi TaxID=2018706 RepID=UPI0020279A89|nr:NADH dehydrogenase subunit 3 [Navicula tsukamotoi]QYB23123.1 NADH dehydrogenase subunit 3 [Navicula tsukamotoi]